MTVSIAAQVAALPKTPTPELKQMWRELYDKEPPGFSRNYLVSRLAYRIQELAYGGLKPATRAKLDALADGLDPKAARKRIVNGPVVGRSSSANGAALSRGSRCSPTASSGRAAGTRA
jgi:hypothetical protein